MTTLLSRAEETEKEPKVSAEELEKLEHEASIQGEKVAEAKAVGASSRPAASATVA